MTKHKSFTTTTTTKLYGNKQSSRPWSTITRGWDAPRSACRDWSAKSRKTCANFYDLSVKISSSCHIIRVTQDYCGYEVSNTGMKNCHKIHITQDYGNIKVVMEVSNRCLQNIFAWEVFKYLGTIQMGSEMAIFAYYQYIEVGWVRKGPKTCLCNIWIVPYLVIIQMYWKENFFISFEM